MYLFTKPLKARINSKLFYKLPVVHISVFCALFLCKERSRKCVHCLSYHNDAVSLRKQDQHKWHQQRKMWKRMNKVLKCLRHLMSQELEKTWWLTDACELRGSGPLWSWCSAVLRDSKEIGFIFTDGGKWVSKYFS